MRRKRSFSAKYRILPIIIFSLIMFAILCAVVILIWSLVLYAGKSTVSETSAIPAIIWLVILFISSVLMTLLTRGGTVIPALLLTVITVILSAIFAEAGSVTAGGFILKLIVSALVAAAGFSVAKLFLICAGRTPQRSRRKRKGTTPPQIFTDTQDHSRGFVEYKD